MNKRSYKGDLVNSLGKVQQRIVKCEACTRLVEFRERIAIEKRASFADWDYWGAPVPSTGDPIAEVLIVGLAPGAHGANRTGRMFTGDPSASFLTSALFRAGFTSSPRSDFKGDGLELKNIFITSALRCVPPNDRATMEEQNNCRHFLTEELKLLKHVKAILALGKVAFENLTKAISAISGQTLRIKFGHGCVFDLGENMPRLFCSYHPSPRNTNTGRLTANKMDSVLLEINEFLSDSDNPSMLSLSS